MDKQVLRNFVYLLHNLKSPYGRYLLAYLKKFRHETKLSPDELRNVRRRRLQDMLVFAKENSPYYKKVLKACLPEPKDVLTISDIKDIPFLTRKVIQKHIEEMKCSTQHRLIKSATGGSTGVPMSYYKDLKKEACGAALAGLAKESIGYKMGDTIIKLWGAPDDFKNALTLKSKWHSFVHNEHLLNAFDMGQSQMERYAQYILRSPVKLMVSYAQTAYQLAKYAIDNNIKMKIPRVILCAETSYDYQMEIIKEGFDCLLYSNYGCRELGSVAIQQDEKGDYIINLPGYIVEVVDNNGNVVETGHTGYLVITDLWNMGMPFIRYKIDDMAVQGRYDQLGSLTLKKITGRSTDMIKTKSGKWVTGLIFIYLFTKDFKEVGEFQIIQNSLENVNIKLVLNNRIQKDKLMDRICNNIKHIIGEDIDINLELVENIKKTPTGKYRPVICNLN